MSASVDMFANSIAELHLGHAGKILRLCVCGIVRVLSGNGWLAMVGDEALVYVALVSGGIW